MNISNNCLASYVYSSMHGTTNVHLFAAIYTNMRMKTYFVPVVFTQSTKTDQKPAGNGMLRVYEKVF